MGSFTDTMMIAAIAIVALLLLLLLSRSARKQPVHKYRLRKPTLLTRPELAFYDVLKQAVGDGAVVFAQVRVADVLKPRADIKKDRKDWQGAFNQIRSKHFDFVICDPKDTRVLLAVELDDQSQADKQRAERDRLLDRACRSAGLPLLRIKAARGYPVQDLRQRVAAAIEGDDTVGNEPYISF